MALQAKYLKKSAYKQTIANITAVCRERQALSHNVPIIILPPIVREKYAKRNFSKVGPKLFEHK